MEWLGRAWHSALQ